THPETTAFRQAQGALTLRLPAGELAQLQAPPARVNALSDSPDLTHKIAEGLEMPGAVHRNHRVDLRLRVREERCILSPSETGDPDNRGVLWSSLYESPIPQRASDCSRATCAAVPTHLLVV